MTKSPQLPEFDNTIKDAVKDAYEQKKRESEQRPFTVSIMGQTGVGKTSLLRALFNRAIFDESINGRMKVDHVNPATTRPETYTIHGSNGQILIVNDLPGIGESSRADENYLKIYEQYLLPSDIILWANQSDSRATTVDVDALERLLGKLDELSQEQLMSKMVFVLTKVDALLPAPWIMEYNKQYVRFSPGEETLSLMQQKQDFFQKQLIQPFGKHIVSHTPIDGSFDLGEPFSLEGNRVRHRGLLTRERVEELSRDRPDYRPVFKRLYANYCPIPCSAHFKYFLTEIMLVILNKLGPEAAQNFKQVVNQDTLGHMTLDEARTRCNIIVWSVPKTCKIFDLEEGIFPDSKTDRVFYKRNKRRKWNNWGNH